MLSASSRNRLAIVLVGARNPQNIGAAARAMQDFGFAHLRVVNEFGAPFEAAQLEASSAVGAGEVMRSAQRFTRLAEAIADCSFVVGTTAIGGRELTQPVLSMQEGAPLLAAALLQMPEASMDQGPEVPGVHSGPNPPEIHPRVALLFGSEKTGLTNAQLSYCSLLLTIPLFAPTGRHLSMNLGQAVAICLYELTRSGFEGARALPAVPQDRPTEADRERLAGLLTEAMQRSGYTRRFPANARTHVVRQLASQLGTSREQAATWMGFLKLITRAVSADDDETEISAT